MSMTDPPTPEDAAIVGIPEFSPRATRRSIRRGMLQTALNAAVIILILLVVLNLLSRVVQNRGGRDEHFASVVGTGFIVAHPDYLFDNPPDCCNIGLTSMSLILSATPRTPDAAGSVNLTIRQNLLGHVTDAPFLTQTPLVQQLVYLHDDGESTTKAKTQAETLLRGLPQRLTATAVIDFATPLTQRAFTQFQHKFHLDGDGAVLLSAAGGRNGPRMLPVSWPDANIDAYQRWVAHLHDSDRKSLSDLGLSLTALRRSAEAPRVYGFVVDSASIPKLRVALDSPAVHTIRLAQVAFDLSGQ